MKYRNNIHESEAEHIRSRMVSATSRHGNRRKVGFHRASASSFEVNLRQVYQNAISQGEPVVHVKDGKPLTPHGAKLLGAPWD
jgi:hypothetical protein